jgi:hypothetical protein
MMNISPGFALPLPGSSHPFAFALSAVVCVLGDMIDFALVLYFDAALLVAMQ